MVVFSAGGFCCIEVILFTESTVPHVPRAALRSAPTSVGGYPAPVENVRWVQMKTFRNLLPGIHKSQQDLTGEGALCLQD